MSEAHVVISDLGPTFGMLAFGLESTASEDPLVALAAEVSGELERDSAVALDELLRRDAAGGRHPRSHACAAALRGGIWFSATQHPARPERIDASGLVGVLVTPEMPFDPKTLTNALPRQVHTQKHARQSALAVGIVRALGAGDYERVGELFDDALVGRAIGSHLPGYHPAVTGARSAGALMVSLSNRGPALGAICDGDAAAEEVRDAMCAALEAHSLSCHSVVSPVAALDAR